MRVFLLKDVDKVGIAGEIIKTNEGFARNFLIPKKIAVEVTDKNESSFVNRIKVVENRKEVVATKTSMLAEKFKDLQVILKRKVHNGDQLYGSISAKEISDELAKQHGIKISNSQLVMDKSIKTKGMHPVTIKLSKTLLPTLQIKIIPETA
ncbi:50S ribosomal protein L9 [Candidatus Dependentiae bacterium]|nr:50S ribosomal protein L9 [Candidatus Dependentiae bacterium]